jgi:hypothetical protein
MNHPIADDLELMAAHVHAESPATKAAKLSALAERVRALEAERDALVVEKAGAVERGQMMFRAKNEWADRATKAEAALAEARELLESTADRLHNLGCDSVDIDAFLTPGARHAG